MSFCKNSFASFAVFYVTKYHYTINMKLTSTIAQVCKTRLVFLGSSKKINSNYNGQFNSTNKDPTDLKTAQRFPNSVFFNTLVFPPILLKIACKRDTLSLSHTQAQTYELTHVFTNTLCTHLHFTLPMYISTWTYFCTPTK